MYTKSMSKSVSKQGLAGRLALTMVLLIAFPWAASSMTFTTFDAPGAGTNGDQGTTALSINRDGEVTGYFADANNVFHGFVRHKDGTFTTFDVPGASTRGQGTFPRSINNHGEIAGYYFDANSVRHGFLWDENGTVITFDPPGSLGTEVWSINNQGEIVGDYAALLVPHAFLRHKDGTFITFDAPGAGTTPHLPGGTTPQGINKDGEIAGYYLDTAAVYHGFVRYKDGTFTTFGVPGAGTGDLQGTLPYSINAHGEVAGLFYAATNGGAHGFVRRRSDGTITAFDPEGSISTVALSINHQGEVAGYYAVSLPGSNEFIHGFVRLDNGTMTTFDVPGAATGVSIVGGTFPMSINAGGDITGYYIDANGVLHGFVAGDIE